MSILKLSVTAAASFLLSIAVNFAIAAPQPAPLLTGDWQFSTPNPNDASLTTITENGAPGGGAFQRLTVSNSSSPLWLIQFSKTILPNVAAGDIVRLHFWAKSTTSNPVRVTVEQSGPPYQAVIEQRIILKQDWQEYTFKGFSEGLGANGIDVHFQGGEQPGVIDVSGVELFDDGVNPELAAAQSALAPDQIQSRIEKYRKGSLTIKVVNRDGKPLNNVTVSVTQTRHAFLFGANFFNLNPSDQSPIQLAYQNEFVALFNYATLPFYWGAFESREGKPDYSRLQTMADWCVAHGISPKGHPLVWHEVWPGWAPNDPDLAIPLLKARVFDLIPRYENTIHYWDVVNEAADGASVQPVNGENAWIRRDGAPAVVGTALDWARAAGAGQQETFIYNDYNISDPNAALLTSLQSVGKLPDAIGIQSHMHEGNWPLTKVWEVCETFGKFGRPIHFTETTVLSGPKRVIDDSKTYPTDWYTTPEGEAEQAAYVTQFYTVLFSNPSVRAITWWDFSDLNAWRGAPAGLVRKDMTPKPAYIRLLDLIHRQWWTKTTGTTSRSGEYSTRVFYGDYTIRVTDSHGVSTTSNITFPEAAPPLNVAIKLP